MYCAKRGAASKSFIYLEICGSAEGCRILSVVRNGPSLFVNEHLYLSDLTFQPDDEAVVQQNSFRLAGDDEWAKRIKTRCRG